MRISSEQFCYMSNVDKCEVKKGEKLIIRISSEQLSHHKLQKIFYQRSQLICNMHVSRAWRDSALPPRIVGGGGMSVQIRLFNKYIYLYVKE